MTRSITIYNDLLNEVDESNTLLSKHLINSADLQKAANFMKMVSSTAGTVATGAAVVGAAPVAVGAVAVNEVAGMVAALFNAIYYIRQRMWLDAIASVTLAIPIINKAFVTKKVNKTILGKVFKNLKPQKNIVQQMIDLLVKSKNLDKASGDTLKTGVNAASTQDLNTLSKISSEPVENIRIYFSNVSGDVVPAATQTPTPTPTALAEVRKSRKIIKIVRG
jgi:hypothetical protein